MEPSSMSMVVRTRVYKPNGHSASNAFGKPSNRDVLDATFAGWAYRHGADRPSQYRGRTPETLRTNSEASWLKETLL
jgi:hypothetical protein